MCGRYALTLPPDVVRALLDYADQPNFPPRYNIAPTQPAAVVIRADDGARRFILMRWGFLPSWLKDPKDFPLVFNVRSEGAADKPAFRNALRRRRALMPADGFYEWRKAGKDRFPFLIRRTDRSAFAFAALWETFSAPDGSEIDTVAIMTTTAPAAFEPIHPRSPVIIDPRHFEQWLDPETPLAEAQSFIAPPQPDLFEAVPISPAINKADNDNASVQTPAEHVAPPPLPKKPRASPRDRSGGDGGQGSLF